METCATGRARSRRSRSGRAAAVRRRALSPPWPTAIWRITLPGWRSTASRPTRHAGCEISARPIAIELFLLDGREHAAKLNERRIAHRAKRREHPCHDSVHLGLLCVEYRLDPLMLCFRQREFFEVDRQTTAAPFRRRWSTALATGAIAGGSDRNTGEKHDRDKRQRLPLETADGMECVPHGFSR